MDDDMKKVLFSGPIPDHERNLIEQGLSLKI